jgi:hypothetical protein
VRFGRWCLGWGVIKLRVGAGGTPRLALEVHGWTATIERDIDTLMQRSKDSALCLESHEVGRVAVLTRFAVTVYVV